MMKKSVYVWEGGGAKEKKGKKKRIESLTHAYERDFVFLCVGVRVSARTL